MAADVLVVGCGLIGTSVGLALTEAGKAVLLTDARPEVVDEAVRRGAGERWTDGQRATLVLVAVPPVAAATVLYRCQSQDLGRTYTHVASVQSHVQAEMQSLGCDMSLVVGGHPMAGRERSGPGAASSDLFVGRPWALCRNSASSDQAVADLLALVSAAGADAVQMSAQAHDAAVALLSHLPQVTASALAGVLLEAPPGRGSTTVMDLVGPGLIDTTRLAASDADLWVQILSLNAAQLAPLVEKLARRLHETARALEDVAGGRRADGDRAADVLDRLLRDGNAGRALVPVKRGAREEAFAPVRVSVRDEPGRLAALLVDAGAAGFNVEDVHVEHIPGRPTGVIELLVGISDVAGAAAALSEQGWSVLGT